MDLSGFFSDEEVEAVRECFGVVVLPDLIVERVLELRIERREWIDKDKKKHKEFYKDGNGMWEAYFENGQKAHEYCYCEGKLYGSFTEWYENGNMACFKSFVNGKVHGKSEIWVRSGPKLYEEYYIDGLKDGLETWYDAIIGGKRMQRTWKNNKKHGLETFWYSNGTIIIEKLWNDGREVSTFVNMQQ